MADIFSKEDYIAAVKGDDPAVIARLYDIIRTDAFMEAIEVSNVIADNYKSLANVTEDEIRSICFRSQGISVREVGDALLKKAGEALHG